MRLLAALLVSLSMLHVGGTANASGPSCGCDRCHPHHASRHCPLLKFHGGCSHHHGCCHCCPGDQRSSRDVEPAFARSAPVAPSGPIVESYPMMRAMPMMAAMPMMMMGTQVRAASLETQSRDDCCAELEKRMNALDERVDAFDLRMQTIQRAVEIQTRILEEIKAQGTIGNQPIKTKASSETE